MSFNEALQKYAADNPHIIDALRLKWSDFIPHMPTPKQRAFLSLPHQEALFGGAAGGGKTDALLMGALQYVDIPGYSAIIFRKTLTDHRLAGSTMSRLHGWLQDALAQRIVKFNAQDNFFSFPTWNADGSMGVPSRISFGYIGEGGVETRYQSAEFQYCAFDELTQHVEDHYLYLFSRLRRIKCPQHKGELNPDCPSCTQLARVPIRMRAATNPGNFGHQWVRNRFQLEADRDPDDPTGKTVRYIGKAPDRPFIPSLAKDNPFLDRDEYVKSLQNLPKVVRDQLLAGDWSVSHDARYKSHWFSRRWSRYGMSYVLGPDGHGPSIQVGNFARVFFTVDPASSSREGPGDKEIWTKISESNMSWTVVCVWAFTHDGHLLLLFMFRVRDEIPQVLDHIKRLYRQWKPNYIVVESSGLGRGVYQLLAMHGLPVRPMHPHTDKVVRATNMMLLAERGRVWLPQQSFNFPWVKEVEDELFVWIGHTLQSDDIVDAFSLAGLDVGVEAVSMVDDSDFVLGDDDTYAVSEGPFVIS